MLTNNYFETGRIVASLSAKGFISRRHFAALFSEEELLKMPFSIKEGWFTRFFPKIKKSSGSIREPVAHVSRFAT